MMVAVAIAPPAHMVISAVLASRRSSSCSGGEQPGAVLPTGYPMAIAPPLTLTRLGRHARTSSNTVRHLTCQMSSGSGP